MLERSTDFNRECPGASFDLRRTQQERVPNLADERAGCAYELVPNLAEVQGERVSAGPAAEDRAAQHTCTSTRFGLFSHTARQ